MALIIIMKIKTLISNVFLSMVVAFSASSCAMDRGEYQVIDGDKVLLDVASDGHYYVNAKVNGFDVLFLIDTGAFGAAVDEKSASEMGLRGAAQTAVKTALGSSRIATSYGNEITIGPLVASPINVSIIPIKAGSSGSRLLGMEFLSQFRVSFDDRHMLIVKR